MLERPWVSFLMDFVVGFPKVDWMNTVMVIIDRFLKCAIFVSTPAVCKAKVVTTLFYKYVECTVKATDFDLFILVPKEPQESKL